MEKLCWIAKTFFGLEEVVAQELRDLNAEEILVLKRAVKFQASIEDIYRIIPSLRCSHFVLLELFEFEAEHPELLYEGIKEYDWTQWLSPKGFFKVEAVVSGEIFTHSKFASLKVKDAIADFFRDKFGERPSVSFDRPELSVHVHINENKIRVLLNACDQRLFKRGYREETGKAPLNECLAAGMLYLADWQNNSELWDPMCGSGTIAIEAALMKADVAPNAHREWFGFMGWPRFKKDVYKETIDSLKKPLPKMDEVKIYSSDMDSEMIHIARKNAQNAGVDKFIKFFKSDIRNPLMSSNDKGIVVCNPPYDERLDNYVVGQLYKSIGDSLKKNFTNKKVFLISSNRDALKKIGLKPSSKKVLFNGGLECHLNSYEIFSGDYRSHKTKLAEKKSKEL